MRRGLARPSQVLGETLLLVCSRVEWALGCYLRPLTTRLLSLLNKLYSYKHRLGSSVLPVGHGREQAYNGYQECLADPVVTSQ